MGIKTNPQKSKLDIFLWAFAFVLIAGTFVANYYFSGIVWPLRLTGWIVLACILGFMLLQTSQGKRFWKFAKEARIELRKVVWPTRKEAVRTTLVVSALVLLTVFILWIIDTILLWIISWITG